MRVTGRRILMALATLACLAVLFWRLAPYNVAASVNHLPPVRAILHSYMENAVGMRARMIEPPDWVDLDDAALIRLGAGHFATGCAPCHGAPGQSRDPITLSMLPEPAVLEHSNHTPEEFYWLARHGLKYTGMPAWSGAGRDDEPWAMAAFLSRYEALTEEEYVSLAFGPVAQPPSGGVAFGGMTGRPATPIGNCTRCHGADGLGRDGTAPKLAGQSETHLLAALDAYAENRRQSGFMEPVAAGLSAETRGELARLFAGMAAPWEGRSGDRGDPVRGQSLALNGDEHREVPSCASCHGGNGSEGAAGAPRISGQDARWIEVWLRMWRDGPIPDTAGAARMAAAARNLSDDQIADLAAFYASAGPVEAR